MTSQILFIGQLLLYSAIASAIIKYLVPNWIVLNTLNTDTINAIALAAITIPVSLFALALWVKR